MSCFKRLRLQNVYTDMQNAEVRRVTIVLSTIAKHNSLIRQAAIVRLSFCHIDRAICTAVAEPCTTAWDSPCSRPEQREFDNRCLCNISTDELR
jgi:hypothetical protein